jgi:hypothetical protein
MFLIERYRHPRTRAMGDTSICRAGPADGHGAPDALLACARQLGAKVSCESVTGIACLTPGQASPARLLTHNRNHWAIEVRHEVALVSEITGMEVGYSTVKSGRVLSARSRSWHASLATAGCEAREEARGPVFHPLVTGKGKAGRANKVNSRKLRYPDLRRWDAAPENRTRRLIH